MAFWTDPEDNLTAEYSPATTLMPGNHIGARLDGAYGNLFWRLALTGEKPFTDSSEDESHAITMHLHSHVRPTDDAILHVGLAQSMRKPGSAPGDSIRYRASPVSRVSKQFIADTGVINDVDNIWLTGTELGFAWKNILLQSEWLQAAVDASAASPTFDGGYAELAWAITGEDFLYNPRNGTFDAGNPYRSLTDNGAGLWMMTARTGYIDLSDDTIQGGMVQHYDLGINWFPHAQMRFMLGHSWLDKSESTANESPRVWMLRSHLDF
jgi:phosphate-selective porin